MIIFSDFDGRKKLCWLRGEGFVQDEKEEEEEEEEDLNLASLLEVSRVFICTSEWLCVCVCVCVCACVCVYLHTINITFNQLLPDENHQHNNNNNNRRHLYTIFKISQK